MRPCLCIVFASLHTLPKTFLHLKIRVCECSLTVMASTKEESFMRQNRLPDNKQNWCCWISWNITTKQQNGPNGPICTSQRINRNTNNIRKSLFYLYLYHYGNRNKYSCLKVYYSTYFCHCHLLYLDLNFPNYCT